MSAGLDASTVTPGSTAPDASLTTPLIVACAEATTGSNSTNPNAKITLPILSTFPPSSGFPFAARTSEIELDAELEEPRDQNLCRSQPVRIGRVFREYRARVERVVDIEVRPRLGSAEVQEFRQAQVDLMDPITVQRP